MASKTPIRLTNERIYDSLMIVGLAAVPLDLNVHCAEICLQADNANQGIIYVGAVGSQSMQLVSGDAPLTIRIDNPSKVYVRAGQIGQVLNYHALGI